MFMLQNSFLVKYLNIVDQRQNRRDSAPLNIWVKREKEMISKYKMLILKQIPPKTYH